MTPLCFSRSGARRVWLISLFLLALLPACSDERDGKPPPDERGGKATAPGAVVVVTVNAHQFTQDVARLRTLSGALADTPTERAPDVVLLQEIEADSVEVLSELLEDEFPDATFEPSGPLNKSVKSKALVNVATNEVEHTVVWTDACDDRNRYLALRLVERADETHYTVAGVHIPWDAGSVCRVRNASLIKQTVDDWDGATVVGGDFNQRAVEELRECDIAETSDPLPWWREMTSDEGPGAFRDAVKIDAQRSGESVGENWTYEGIGPTTLCNGAEEFRRNRIDYIFVRGADVLDAGADDPGWAGEDPGTYRCRVKTACRYSDHRFVWARLGI